MLSNKCQKTIKKERLKFRRSFFRLSLYIKFNLTDPSREPRINLPVPDVVLMLPALLLAVVVTIKSLCRPITDIVTEPLPLPKSIMWTVTLLRLILPLFFNSRDNFLRCGRLNLAVPVLYLKQMLVVIKEFLIQPNIRQIKPLPDRHRRIVECVDFCLAQC